MTSTDIPTSSSDIDIDLTTLDTDTDTGAGAGAGVGGVVELTEALTGAVRKAIASQVAEAAQLIAKGALDEVLTEEVAEEMRVAAVRDALAAVDPQQGEDPVEKLKYRNLELFVSEFLARVYRREVTREGSQKKARWCPVWWDHGEAVARLAALWRSFERMRQGDGVEMSVWWLHHADPMMDRLLDPENGPFRYCSVADGHVRRLTKLPVVEIPDALKFADGYIEDQQPDTTTAALPVTSLYLPPATGQARRVVIREFP
ncbi:MULTISPECIES: DUF4913 domain-containing protein [Nocardia]|uniref:DUF4913 domain-containing protein n=1 Tax=Nocardia farcinica (strain IFM 10152) TaxID=247156 RepID=Q5YM68_NOCFA|nr:MULTISPECIES: DUF4913 domain-containing protein [Nocardia]PEH74539.1 DUF4913 domain-containing protein [Nocardia sp. FDAARGOS_372]UEX26310.1 DUF4913 domain-containing protein [Nocardia farcinica]BAD60723.1 hypothetical protein PNF2_380 [Nocardia farcinica IFM 10152]